MSEQKERVRHHYGDWAATYGEATDDGLFAWVRAREVRLVYELLGLEAGQSVLDAGCGSGVYTKVIFARGHEVWAVDFAPEMVDRVRGHATRVEQSDIEGMALGRQFDRVLCVGVLEWVTSPAAAIGALAAHVNPGGRLVLLVPRTGPGGWIYEHQKAKHGLAPRLYGVRETRRMGEAAGLRYRAHVTPWVHNFAMSFDASPS